MQTLASTLSAIQAEYETAKLQAAVPDPATSSTEALNPGAAPNLAAGETGGEATVQAGTTAATVPTAGEGGTTVPVPVATSPALAPVLDGPALERKDRDRTPPPVGGRAKAIAKMSDAELAGPRKAKGGSKAGASATATVIA